MKVDSEALAVINNFFHKDSLNRGIGPNKLAKGMGIYKTSLYSYWHGEVLLPTKFMLNYAEFVGIPKSEVYRMVADALDEAEQEKNANEQQK